MKMQSCLILNPSQGQQEMPFAQVSHQQLRMAF